MTFFNHINVLRKHLWFSVIIILIGFILSLYFYDDIIKALITPLKTALKGIHNQLYLTTVYEGFLIRVKVSLIAGFALTLPVHIINFLIFLIPALTSRERKILTAVILSGFLLIIISLYYSHQYLIPLSITFMTGSSIITEGSSFLLGFTKNIIYLLQFFTALIIIFQLPLLIILLISLKIISVNSAFFYGRYMVLSAFIISAVLTPPDFVSQIMTAIPLIFLYYLSLLIAKIFRLGVR